MTLERCEAKLTAMDEKLCITRRKDLPRTACMNCSIIGRMVNKLSFLEGKVLSVTTVEIEEKDELILQLAIMGLPY